MEQTKEACGFGGNEKKCPPWPLQLLSRDPMSINPGFPFARQHALVSLSPLTPVSATSTMDAEASLSQSENPVVINFWARRDRLSPYLILTFRGKCGED
jgi:hypothetical protein